MPPEVPLSAVPAVAQAPTAGLAALGETEARQVDLWWAGGMVVALLATFLLLSLFSGVAVPLLLALAYAYVLNPVVNWLEGKGLSRTWGAVAVFAGIALLAAGAVLYLIPVFRAEASKLPEFFRTASAQLGPRLEALTGLSLPELLASRAAELGAEASELLKSAGPAAARWLGGLASNTARVVATLLGLLVVPVLAFLFLQDYTRLVELGRSLLPRRARALLSRRFGQVDEVLSAFARGQVLVGAILSAIYAAGLSVARIDLAIVIGVIAGFGNMVPYVGTGIGVVLALLGVLLSWHAPWQLLVVALTFGLGQLLESFVITPKVVGDRVGLPTVVVIVAILAFGELFGFLGVLLAVPAAAVLKVVLQVVVERYRKSPLYLGESAGPAPGGPEA